MNTISGPNLTVDIIPILDDNFLFCISSKTRFWVVDPGDAKAVWDYAENSQKSLEGILITHDHADHIGGLKQVLQRFPMVTCISSTLSRASDKGRKLKINEQFQILDSSATVLDLSGHTKEQIGFYFEKENWLFSGDALFHLGCGRIFSGTPSEAFESLQRIKRLPDQTEIFCSHDYTEANSRFFTSLNQRSLLGYGNAHRIPLRLDVEKEWNPFLTVDSLELFTKLRQERNLF